MDERGNTVIKDKEKAEILISFFASVLLVTPVVLQDLSLGEQNGSPIIQGEVVSDLLQHVSTHRSVGWMGFSPGILRKLMEELTESLPIINQQSWGGPKLTGGWQM